MWGRVAAARAVSSQWKEPLMGPIVIQELTIECFRFRPFSARFPRLV